MIRLVVAALGLLAWIALDHSQARGQSVDQPLALAVGTDSDETGSSVASADFIGSMLSQQDVSLISADLPLKELATVSQIELLQQQIDELKQAESAGQIAVPAWVPMPESKKETKTFPDYKITGFFQIDTAYFSQSAASILTLGDIQDGTSFRRARLAATGNLTERGSYIMEFDFAQSQPRFVDVWGQIKDTPLGNLRIGRFRQPIGMSELTSVRELPFLERPSIFGLSAFRQTGMMLFDTACDEQMTWAVSGYRSFSDFFGNVYGQNGGYGTAERLTALLVDQGDYRVFHVGLDHAYLQPARDQLIFATVDEIFVGQQPNLGPAGLSVFPIVGVPPFVNSGIFNVDDVNNFNAEAAVGLGRGLIQSEYRWVNVNLPSGDNVTVHGGYVQARYVLTGEVIPYNRTGGVFGRIKPNCPLDFSKGNCGAWELAGRVSTIDLNPLFGQPGVPGPGRRLTSYSVALNWYWWANAKCQFEFVHGQLNDPVIGNSSSSTFAARAQFDF